jgi:hypothetical protein
MARRHKDFIKKRLVVGGEDRPLIKDQRHRLQVYTTGMTIVQRLPRKPHGMTGQIAHDFWPSLVCDPESSPGNIQRSPHGSRKFPLPSVPPIMDFIGGKNCRIALPAPSPPADASGPDADRLTHLRFTSCFLPDVCALAITRHYSQWSPGLPTTAAAVFLAANGKIPVYSQCILTQEAENSQNLAPKGRRFSTPDIRPYNRKISEL